MPCETFADAVRGFVVVMPLYQSYLQRIQQDIDSVVTYTKQHGKAFRGRLTQYGTSLDDFLASEAAAAEQSKQQLLQQVQRLIDEHNQTAKHRMESSIREYVIKHMVYSGVCYAFSLSTHDARPWHRMSLIKYGCGHLFCRTDSRVWCVSWRANTKKSRPAAWSVSRPA